MADRAALESLRREVERLPIDAPHRAARLADIDKELATMGPVKTVERLEAVLSRHKHVEADDPRNLEIADLQRDLNRVRRREQALGDTLKDKDRQLRQLDALLWQEKDSRRAAVQSLHERIATCPTAEDHRAAAAAVRDEAIAREAQLGRAHLHERYPNAKPRAMPYPENEERLVEARALRETIQEQAGAPVDLSKAARDWTVAAMAEDAKRGPLLLAWLNHYGDPLLDLYDGGRGADRGPRAELRACQDDHERTTWVVHHGLQLVQGVLL